jgi:F420-dependent oxidoreductase-like protein
MKIGLSTGYWGSGPPADAADAVTEADRLGFDSIWTAEAYGSDALTPLAWWGARTQNVKLGTSIIQLSARTPAATAMAAMTLDHLCDGRVLLGLGASGPQVVEGWYGQPYPKPLARTREYVEIIKRIVRRDDPVSFAGEHYQLPYAGGTGLGKPLKSTIHPRRAEIPIYIAAEGPKNVALAAEIGDGWLPLFFSPKEDGFYRQCLAEGFAAAGDAGKAERFEVAAPTFIVPGDDVEKCADMMRPMVALYAGGMGARGANFHFDVFARMGWEAEATKIQDLYLEGRKPEAIASVPLAMVEDVALVGPIDKIRGELDRWRDTCLTTMLVSGPPSVLGMYADLIGG